MNKFILPKLIGTVLVALTLSACGGAKHAEDAEGQHPAASPRQLAQRSGESIADYPVGTPAAASQSLTQPDGSKLITRIPAGGGTTVVQATRSSDSKIKLDGKWISVNRVFKPINPALGKVCTSDVRMCIQ